MSNDRLIRCEECNWCVKNQVDPYTGKPFCSNWKTWMGNGCFHGSHVLKDQKLVIHEIWPVSTEIVPLGGIGINWSGPQGFGEVTLYWDDNQELHADTEYMGEEFLNQILDLLPGFMQINN